MILLALIEAREHRACNRSVSRLTHSGPTVFNQRVDPTFIAVKQTLVSFAELKLLLTNSTHSASICTRQVIFPEDDDKDTEHSDVELHTYDDDREWITPNWGEIKL